MKIAFTARFKKAWKELEQDEKNQAANLQFLKTDILNPASGVKEIKGTDNVWEARVNRFTSMTFQVRGDMVILRNIGRYDETLKKP